MYEKIISDGGTKDMKVDKSGMGLYCIPLRQLRETAKMYWQDDMRDEGEAAHGMPWQKGGSSYGLIFLVLVM